MSDAENLSRTVSHALRHAPADYGLQLDEDGWVALADVVEALRERGFPGLAPADVEAMVEGAVKKRHEIAEGRIRANYGHSVVARGTLAGEQPPAVLFHGTTPDAAQAIAREGLKPMARQHVHLSPDRTVARGIALRRTDTPVILTVRAGDAFAAGIPFERREDVVWVSAAIPAEFIEGA
jgi:putative RNA 2'-phosphotransferase